MHAPLYLQNMKYSKTIDAFFQSGYSTDETKDILEKLKKEKIIDKINNNFITALNNKGYNHNTINYILITFNKTETTKILAKKYDADFEEYITLDLFDINNYKRYVSYQKDNKTLSLDDIVTRVELDLDKDPYEDPKEEKDPNSLTALVNKHRNI